MINKIMHPKEVKALDHYKIWVLFPDGVSGEVDLSDLKGKGVFQIWDDYEKFKNVYIDPVSRAIAWNNEIDICADTIYEELVNKYQEEECP